MTWTQTYTGLKFDFNDPESHEYSLIDIAHHLSLICRYGGATRFHYSVGQHSVAMALSMWANTHNAYYALDCLIHDAAEAYVGDIKTPIKQLLPEFRAVEARVDAALRKRLITFGAMKTEYAKTKEYDRRILLDERRQVLGPTPHEWGLPADLKPLEVILEPCEPNNVELAWLEWFGTFSRKIVGDAVYRSALERNMECLRKKPTLV